LRSSKTVYVFDDTPIIHFAKVQKLDLLLRIGEVYVKEKSAERLRSEEKGDPTPLQSVMP